MLELDEIQFKRGNLQIGPLNLSVSTGEILSICGKNGSGKTSTLIAINGYIPLLSGKITVDGRDLKSMKPRDIARKISYVQQEIPEPMGFNVMDVMEISGFTRPGSREDVLETLALCGVEKFIDRDFATLSGGEKRMVSIAAGIYQNSEYIMMDEPTSFLDLDKINKLSGILKVLKSSGKGILLVMHDINLAYRISDSIVLMKEGKVLVGGTKENVMNIKNLEIVYDAKFGQYNSPEGTRFYPLDIDFNRLNGFEEAREYLQHS
ncbi:MAG: ABC transporter ATP-binding protein [Cuniculiplasma sp.]